MLITAEYKQTVKTDLIALPEKNSETKRSPFATVLAVGPQVSQFKPGDRIIWETDRDQKEVPIIQDNAKVRLIYDNYVVATVEDD